jgi:thioredoxin 1
MSSEVTITKENFGIEVLQSPIPVLVDFWAPWCGPCKMIAPVLAEIAGEYSGRLKVGKINVDEQGDLAGQHNVVSIPTLVFYKDGQIQAQKTGAMPKYEIISFFNSLL